MLVTLAPVFGVLAGVVGVVDTVPYVRDIMRGSTRPHRGTWLIWGLLAIVVCVSQRADGASWSLVMAGTQAVLTSLIFVLAIRRGEGGLSAVDGILIAIAAAMMIPKVYRDPGSETLVTFVLAGAGGALAAGAVGAADLSLLCYPIYYCLVNWALALLIHQRRALVLAVPAPSA
jgi:hypothetical protein